ncbi:transposase [Nostoc sp. DedQUE08]|uniref:transposase n=1 Tax=Nostoc sp. DedQUE08 TaxID=3075393 RepID=UPI003A100B8C
MLIGEREIILCIDKTGDKKKGKSTDYVTRQYTGNLGKTENGWGVSKCLWCSRWDYLSVNVDNL